MEVPAGKKGYICSKLILHLAVLTKSVMKNILSEISGIVCLCSILFSASQPADAQILFSENFENNTLGPAWHPVSGDWRISDVQEMKIAPAENGYTYVLV